VADDGGPVEDVLGHRDHGTGVELLSYNGSDGDVEGMVGGKTDEDILEGEGSGVCMRRQELLQEGPGEGADERRRRDACFSGQDQRIFVGFQADLHQGIKIAVFVTEPIRSREMIVHRACPTRGTPKSIERSRCLYYVM
jgi:hypothetical protein